MRFHIKKTFAKDLLLYSNGLACSKGGECSDAAFSPFETPSRLSLRYFAQDAYASSYFAALFFEGLREVLACGSVV